MDTDFPPTYGFHRQEKIDRQIFRYMFLYLSVLCLKSYWENKNKHSVSINWKIVTCAVYKNYFSKEVKDSSKINALYGSAIDKVINGTSLHQITNPIKTDPVKKNSPQLSGHCTFWVSYKLIKIFKNLYWKQDVKSKILKLKLLCNAEIQSRLPSPKGPAVAAMARSREWSNS